MDHESGKISNRSAICPHDILITPHDISRNNLLDKNIQHEIVQKTFFSITMEIEGTLHRHKEIIFCDPFRVLFPSSLPSTTAAGMAQL